MTFCLFFVFLPPPEDHTPVPTAPCLLVVNNIDINVGNINDKMNNKMTSLVFLYLFALRAATVLE